MLETFFLTINEWIAGGTAIAALGCFVWGMISVVFSPCHLASIPLIVAYVGGQDRAVNPKQAGIYSAAFTIGLFITIALIGIICALLGRMLGDVGNYWQILVGLVLVWVALGMFGVEKCSMSGSLVYRLNLKGIFGALMLGLAYGVLSGSCTFGFIAPILAIITVQQKVATGILFILLFAIGHCLPIVVAGSSTAAVKRVLENSRWQEAGNWFRKGAGALIGLLGIYFVINPFVRIMNILQ
jgi:cytochrome c-type biogenesis protein